MKLQRMKSSMMQRINVLQNNRSVFWMVHCAKIWTHTSSANGFYSRSATDKSLVVLKNLKVIIRLLMRFQIYFQTTSCCTNSLMTSFSNDDYITRLVLRACIFGKPYTFPHQSHLLSTTVLNDISIW